LRAGARGDRGGHRRLGPAGREALTCGLRRGESEATAERNARRASPCGKFFDSMERPSRRGRGPAAENLPARGCPETGDCARVGIPRRLRVSRAVRAHSRGTADSAFAARRRGGGDLSRGRCGKGSGGRTRRNGPQCRVRIKQRVRSRCRRSFRGLPRSASLGGFCCGSAPATPRRARARASVRPPGRLGSTREVRSGVGGREVSRQFVPITLKVRIDAPRFQGDMSA
jgi:hypothetical protein